MCFIKNQIKLKSSKVEFNKGLKLFNEGISKYSTNFNENLKTINTQIKNYNVEIQINKKKQELENFKCTCHYNQKKLICKHLVSLALSYEDNNLKKKEISIIGAFDRYNYGDILFPIILEKKLNESKKISEKFEFKFYGLIKKNLENIGGKKTEGINKVYQSEKNSVIIVSGGEILVATWDIMLRHLVSNKKNKILKILKIFLGKKIINHLGRIILKGNTKLPWLIKKSKKKDQIIIYNTIGGTHYKNSNKYFQKEVIKRLNEADFISVRENKTKNDLSINKNIKLHPDSAILLSSLMKKKEIEKKSKIKIKLRNREYIVFQISKKSFESKQSIIIKELKKINEKYNIILLPLGFVNEHDDIYALKKIKKKINDAIIITQECTIYDIIHIISNSKAFIGTSLHGNITAISYEVPNIGIDKNITKLDNFLKTWKIYNGKGCVDFNEINEKLKEVENIDKNKLFSKKEELIKKTNENFKIIMELIEKS